MEARANLNGRPEQQVLDLMCKSTVRATVRLSHCLRGGVSDSNGILLKYMEIVMNDNRSASVGGGSSILTHSYAYLLRQQQQRTAYRIGDQMLSHTSIYIEMLSSRRFRCVGYVNPYVIVLMATDRVVFPG